jgi:hypothetical protein
MAPPRKKQKQQAILYKEEDDEQHKARLPSRGRRGTWRPGLTARTHAPLQVAELEDFLFGNAAAVFDAGRDDDDSEGMNIRDLVEQARPGCRSPPSHSAAARRSALSRSVRRRAGWGQAWHRRGGGERRRC